MPTIVTKLHRFINHPSIKEIIPDGASRIMIMHDVQVKAVAHKSGLGHRFHIPASAYGKCVGPKNRGPIEFRSHITATWVESIE